MNVRPCADLIDVIKTYAEFHSVLLKALIDEGDGRVTEETAIQALINQEWIMLRSDKSVALCQIIATAHSPIKMFFVHTVAGELADCVAAMADIKVIAAQAGCHKVEISGRKGWERVLAGQGFQFSSLNMVADVAAIEENNGR